MIKVESYLLPSGCTIKITKKNNRCKYYQTCKFYSQCLEIICKLHLDHGCGFISDCKGYKKKDEEIEVWQSDFYLNDYIDWSKKSHIKKLEDLS